MQAKVAKQLPILPPRNLIYGLCCNQAAACLGKIWYFQALESAIECCPGEADSPAAMSPRSSSLSPRKMRPVVRAEFHAGIFWLEPFMLHRQRQAMMADDAGIMQAI